MTLCILKGGILNQAIIIVVQVILTADLPITKTEGGVIFTSEDTGVSFKSIRLPFHPAQPITFNFQIPNYLVAISTDVSDIWQRLLLVVTHTHTHRVIFCRNCHWRYCTHCNPGDVCNLGSNCLYRADCGPGADLSLSKLYFPKIETMCLPCDFMCHFNECANLRARKGDYVIIIPSVIHRVISFDHL